MAASNSSRSRGIHVEETPWGCHTKGAREALIQHGITVEGPFPGDPGEKKTTCKAIDPHGRAIRIQRISKTTFHVYRDWSDEEKALFEQRRKREQEIQSARKTVASWPESAGVYRDRLRRYIAGATYGIERWLDGGHLGGFRLDDPALARLYEISGELRELVESGGIVMDPELRKKATPACIEEELGVADTSAPEATQLGGNVIPFRQIRAD